MLRDNDHQDNLNQKKDCLERYIQLVGGRLNRQGQRGTVLQCKREADKKKRVLPIYTKVVWCYRGEPGSFRLFQKGGEL